MGRHDPALTIAISGRAGLARGLYAGTRVLTEGGWARVERLEPGMLVHLRDGAPVPVVSVEPEVRPALWAVRIPAEALGNPAEVLLPPGQPVLIESAYARPYAGESETLVPASSLEGWRGIMPLARANPGPILRLRLDRPGLIEAGPGLALGVEGGDRAEADLLSRLLGRVERPVLPLAAARHLVTAMIAEAAGRALRHATLARGA